MKVFSVSKYVEDMRSYGHSDSAIRRYLLSWAAKCHGLTKEEMIEIRLATHENWMEERKEEEITMNKKEGIKRKRRAWVFLPDRTKTMFNIYTDKIHSYIKWNKKWWKVTYRPEYGEYDVLWEANLESLKERKEENKQ